MRLWHIDLIPYLPKSQLLAQWRELNSIFKKQDKHILINYIYKYPKDYLYYYSNKVLVEMVNRGISIKSWDNYRNYFSNFLMSGVYTHEDDEPLKYDEHNAEYLAICYHNLLEKYRRGQKDFSEKQYSKLTKLYHTYCI